jgi:hypothetical protein
MLGPASGATSITVFLPMTALGVIDAKREVAVLFTKEHARRRIVRSILVIAVSSISSTQILNTMLLVLHIT